MTGPKRVLFVCVENANRSQMAEAFAGFTGIEAVHLYKPNAVRRGANRSKTPCPAWSARGLTAGRLSLALHASARSKCAPYYSCSVIIRLRSASVPASAGVLSRRQRTIRGNLTATPDL
jgi:hypothetical protein